MLDGLDFDFSNLQNNLPAGTISEKKEYGPDERFWKISKNENDQGTAVIRLLVDKNKVPFVRIFHHSFKKYDPTTQKTRWFIEDSPETIKLPCPVSEEWQRLYNMGTEEGKNQAKLFSRKIKYYTNILVVNDPANPENNGKIFLWEFGTKLLDKILGTMNPTEEDRKVGIKPVQLYHPIEGANIMLKIKKASGFFNYDDTQILPASAEWSSMEAALNDIENKTYELNEFISPAHFKSYDELKSKLEFVITGIPAGKKNNTVTEDKGSNVNDLSFIDTGMGAATTASANTSVVQETVSQTEKPVEQPKTVTATTANTSSNEDLSFLDDL